MYGKTTHCSLNIGTRNHVRPELFPFSCKKFNPFIQNQKIKIMSHSDNTDIGVSLSPEAIAQGHGQFPYVIVRMHYAIYMQMPIHFVSDKKEGMKGITVKSDVENFIDNFPYLIEVAAEYKRSLDTKSNRNHRLCLVVGKDHAYYFEEDEIRFNTSIPTGGTLVNSDQRVIAMGHEHFIQQ